MGAPVTEETFPPTYKPKFVQRLGRDLFIVYGTIRHKRFLKVNRNMIVLRHKGELTLINPIRLTVNGERMLQRLGRVVRLIRLNTSHDERHDLYYMQRCNAELWTPQLSDSHPKLVSDYHILDEDTVLPIPNAEVFCFRDTVHPEAALLLRRKEGNILLTSEALQYQWENPFINVPARTIMKLGGFMENPIVVSPTWLKSMSPRKTTLRDDFERLLKLDFSQLIGASGTMVPIRAKEGVVIAVEHAFPWWD